MQQQVNKIISCMNVPAELLEKTNAKLHFRKFGRILRLCLRPKSRTCSIEYDNEASAQRAIVEAGEYNGQKFSISWDMHKSPVKKKRSKKVVDADWNLDPDVQSELAAMSSEHRMSSNYNFRPEVMVVDAEVMQHKSRTNRKSWKAEVPKNVPSTNLCSKKWSTEQVDLLNTLKQPAFTPEEKYKVLEARDKLVRLRTKKNMNLMHVHHTIGTCTDMCPEKERVMRETQHQVHVYEQEENGRGMNHSLAVKQYSRSSADQEVPLPYELRPISTLQLTMGYFMHNILDMCDSPDINIGEWFHFLWDRMRSIRKDITQQELCCEGSVELLEQCARFHIHCSARLVAEDPSVFDQKINTENLTKCLQTLKYMYHDLKLKGVFCVNEPEFRTYIILLNLNDGNFMWEVQQLHYDIIKSQEVKFGLEVYSALDKNNYIKFFKLVRSTSYLKACILLRYFIQVRLRALTTMLKSYSPRSPYTQFPLQELASILAFEDLESTADFLACYNLIVNPEGTHVILDRKAFCDPDLPYTLDRAVNVIERKRNCSVGEVVCGKPLPTPYYENYVPRTSFDRHGLLQLNEFFDDVDHDKISSSEMDKKNAKPAATTSLDFSKPNERNVKVKVLTEHNKDVHDKKPQKNVNNEEEIQPFWSTKPKHSATPLYIPQVTTQSAIGKQEHPEFCFRKADCALPVRPINTKEKKGGFKFDLPAEPMKTVPHIFSAVPFSTIAQNAFQTYVPPKSTYLVQNSALQSQFNAPEKTLWEPKRKELPAVAVPASFLAIQTTDLQNANNEAKRKAEEVRLEQIKRLEAEKRKEEERIKLQKVLKERERKMELELMEEHRLQEQRHQQKERLKLLETQHTVRDVLESLLAQVEEQTKLNRLLEISSNIQKRCVLKIVRKWQEKVNLNKRKRKAVDQCPMWIYGKSTEEEAKELFSKTQDITLKNMKRYKGGVPLDFKIHQEKPLEKINLYKLTFQTLLSKASQDSSKIRNKLFWKMNISIPDSYEVKNGLMRITNCLNTLFNWKTKNDTLLVIEQHRNAYHRIVYCIEKQEGIKAVKDSNGFLFISKDLNEVFINRFQESIRKYNKQTCIPIFFILETVNDDDKLQNIVTSEIISKYKVVTTQFTASNLASCISDGIVFLASHLNSPPPLELDILKSFLLKYLATEPWKRVSSFAKWNRAYKSCLMKPRIVVKLYNEALEHLKAVILDDDLQNYENFPEMFEDCLDSKIPDFLPCDYKYFPHFWSTFSYKTFVGKLIDSLKLPNYTAKWPEDERELERIVFEYCTHIFKEPEVQFYKIMARILQSMDSTKTFHKNVRHILWTDIIEVIGTEMVLKTDFLLKHTPFNSECVFKECFVVYNVNKLNEYKTKPWFYVENPVIHEEINMDNLLENEPDVKRPKYIDEDFYDIDLDKTLNEIDNETSETQEALNKSKTDIKSIENLLADLEESMGIAKKISLNFDKTLEQGIKY